MIKKIIFLLYCSFFLLVALLAYTLCRSVLNVPVSIVCALGAFFLSAFVFDKAFCALYFFKTGKRYEIIPKISFNKMYFEPHPYLPYVYKRNFMCQKAMAAQYPLNKDKGYMFSQLKTNNFRHVNGQDGGRDIVMPKPDGLIRINCLGSSAMGNYIFYRGKNYSYPMELERILSTLFPDKKIEVNNCAQGGYTTAEILIKFALDTVDTQPDVVIIYHGYNDLGPSLTPSFCSDYSHAKRNLGETYHLYRLASYIPYIPLASWNFMVNRFLFSQNVRFSLTEAVSRGRADIGNNYKGIDTYKRNIEHMIHICQARGIKVVLSTSCYYIYPAIQGDKWHIKYKEGVALENDVIRELARKYDLPLVDNDLLIPREDRYFVDNLHFSHEGMEMLANNISQKILDCIKELGR